MENTVHIFSVYDPTRRVTRFLYVPVKPAYENPTNEQVLAATEKVQRYVGSYDSNGIVSYLGIGQEAMSKNNPDPEDQRWEPRQA